MPKVIFPQCKSKVLKSHTIVKENLIKFCGKGALRWGDINFL
jgi:hypothetical protein